MAMARGQITFLLQLLLLSATKPSLAQQSNSTSHHSSPAGGFTPSIVIVLVILIFALVLLTLFSIYINWVAQASAPSRRAFRAAPQTVDGAAHSDHRRQRGLDRELVEAFPTAVYGDVKARMAAKSGSLECAVCLSEFADCDELRVLPACCHVFHPDCIDPWLTGAITCPLCRADLTGPPALPAADSCNLTAPEEEAQEESEEFDVGCLLSSVTPESDIGFGTSRGHDILGARYYHYRRTQSAMDAPDRHTLRLPDHVMKELAAVRRHRRAASIAGYPDGVERTPGWLTSFWRSMSWQRQSRADSDAGEEHGGSKRVFPVAGAPISERPSGSGYRGDDREKSDVDASNRV